MTECDDEVTQVTRVYIEAQKKLAATVEAGEAVVDAALALERVVVAEPQEAKAKITSALPEAMQAMPCRVCGLAQFDHFLVTEHPWIARNEDR